MRPTRARGSGRALISVLLLSSVLAACGSPGASPLGTSGSCLADTRAPGAAGGLEDVLPTLIDSRPPTTVDSGLNCTERSLGTYWRHGIRELTFAGATWDEGGGNGTVAAVVTARPVGQPALQTAWVEEFYEAGARAGRKTDNITTSRPELGAAGTVFRLDALNDLSFQTVVVWPDTGFVRVVIVATDVGPTTSRASHDGRVAAAVDAAANAPGLDGAVPTPT